MSMAASEGRIKTVRRLWRRKCNTMGVLLGMLVLAPILVMIFDRREPVIFEKGRMTPRIAQPGQIVEVRWYARFERNCEGDFVRRIIDASGAIHVLVIDLAVYPEPKRVDHDTEIFTREFQLPQGLVNGPAFYQPRGVHWCNVLQKWLWPIEFEPPWVPFTVSNEGPVQEEVPPNSALPERLWNHAPSSSRSMRQLPSQDSLRSIEIEIHGDSVQDRRRLNR